MEGGGGGSGRPCCRALYDFRGEYPGELSFSAGELIHLSGRVNAEWMRGILVAGTTAAGTTGAEEKEGIFPANFVEILVPLPGKDAFGMPAVPSSSSSSTLGGIGTLDDACVGMASVLYDFDSRYGDELSVKAGDSLQVLAFVDSEWVKCRDPSSNRVGIVPQAFLNIFLDSLTTMAPQFEAASSPSLARPWSTEIASPTSLYPQLKASSSLDRLNMLPFAWELAGNPPNANIAPPPRPPPPKMKTSKPFTDPFEDNFGTNSFKSHGFHQKPIEMDVEEAVEADESLTGAANATAFSLPSLQLDTSTMDKSESKAKVLLDLLNTERTYLFDLKTWRICIQESMELGSGEKKALTNGYPELERLAQSLIEAIEGQKDLPSGEQALGASVFMALKDQFFTAFAHFFMCVEQISSIIENESDQRLRAALQKCVEQMRSRGSNVFDVATAVSRPIQRCLRYPLYVAQLLKNTPINHPDHPKLMESLRQLESLASKMNECKRRKELVQKYKAGEELSIADRLARINMHSLVKKSNRLKFRINRTIGLGGLKDSEFDCLVQFLEEAERRLCKFLYCAQLYRKHLELGVKRHEESYKGLCQVQDELVLKAFAQMFRRVDELCRAHMRAFEQEIVLEGKRLVRSELTKLIHKRFDKLADFEAAKNSGKNADELDMRRNEFEALNSQIKAKLPRLIGTMNTKVLQLVQRVNELDQLFLGRMDEWFERERPAKVRECAPTIPSLRAFLPVQLRHTLVEMDKIAASLYQRQALNSGGGEQMKRKSIRRLSLRAPKPSSGGGGGRHNASAASFKPSKRPQNVKERDALLKICRAQNQLDRLRRVRRDWEGAGGLVLREGDLLWVKELRQNGFCLSDNAVAIGLVPLDLLCPIDSLEISQLLTPTKKEQREENLAQFAAIPKRQTSFEGPGQQPRPVSHTFTGPSKAGEKDLIDLEENLIDLNFDSSGHSAMRVDFGTGNNCANVPDDPFEELFQSVVQMSPASSSDPKEELCPPKIPERSKQLLLDEFGSFSNMAREEKLPEVNSQPYTAPPASSFESGITTSSGIQPIRIAPPPPSHKKRTASHYYQPPPTNVPEAMLVPAPNPTMPLAPLYDECPPPPQQQQQQQCHFSTFAVCIFDFEPTSSNFGQLRMGQGERVEILRRNDDAGNGQWWLVRRVADGTQGFVPANYLSLSNTRV